MTDEEFLAAVNDGALDGGFTHAAHVRTAWVLLGRQGLGRGGQAMVDLIDGMARSAGAPDKFHATITWGFVLLVHERMADGHGSWDAFISANPDLLEWPNRALHSRWSPDLLATSRARARFVLPDRAAGPPALA